MPWCLGVTGIGRATTMIQRILAGFVSNDVLGEAALFAVAIHLLRCIERAYLHRSSYTIGSVTLENSTIPSYLNV